MKELAIPIWPLLVKEHQELLADEWATKGPFSNSGYAFQSGCSGS
jgi:hypothetical protein